VIAAIFRQRPFELSSGFLDQLCSLSRAFQTASMILKNVFIAMLCTTLLAWSVLSMADEYRPDEFSPRTFRRRYFAEAAWACVEFAPVAVEAEPIGKRSAQAPWNQAHAKRVVSRTRCSREQRCSQEGASAYARGATGGAARTKLARHHGNPLDAEARDTRIQVWPCKSVHLRLQKQKN